MKIPRVPDESYLKSDEFTQKLIQKAFLAAADKYALTASGATNVEDIEEGSPFVIPLVLPEGVETGDGRSFKEGTTTWRDLPIPLLWQILTDDGHDRSALVGRIDSIERVDGGVGNARGIFDTGEYAREAERLVRGGFLRGISADLDKFSGTAQAQTLSDDTPDDVQKIESQKIIVDASRIMGVTLVPKPAFQECVIKIDEGPDLSTGDEDITVEPGIYEEIEEDMLSALAASAAPIVPPRDWFNNPNLSQATPLTVDDEGRVFGHIAAWDVDHIGLPQATKPPRSASKYAYFRTGQVRTTEGDVAVGQLTLAGGHAPLHASANDAVKHYDDTASAIADVAAGEDQYGIWVSGALRPEATPSQVRALRASAPSGDWRPIRGRLELVAVCQVNVPGFPIARTMVASSGAPLALVAAGARPLAEIRENSKLADLEAKLATLETLALQDKVEQLSSEMADSIGAKNERLQSLAASARDEMNEIIDRRNTELSAAAEELRNFFKQ